jgi:methylmalonyl-CoA mutase N-terminal domain/subunit
MTRENGRTASGRVVLPVYSRTDRSGTDDVWTGYRLMVVGGGGMGRGCPWDMEVVVGGGDRVDVNARCRLLIEGGATGLVIPVRTAVTNGDQATGADAPLVDSLDDMLELTRDIDIGSVSLTVEADRAAPVVFALSLAAAQRRGVSWSSLRGRVGHDLLDASSASWGMCPPEVSAGLSVDLLRFCQGNVPHVTPLSLGAYRLGDAGATPTQELSEAMSAALDCLDRADAAGADVALAASRVVLSVGAQGDVFEVAAKCRAARLVWTRILRERFGVVSDATGVLRLHLRLSATASSPGEAGVDSVRVTFQLLAAAIGGVETVSTPDDLCSRGTWPLRSHQVMAWESGLGGTVDPLGGSYYLERLTQDIADEVMASLADVMKVRRSLGAAESVGLVEILVAGALGGATVADMWGDLIARVSLAQPGGRHTGT